MTMTERIKEWPGVRLSQKQIDSGEVTSERYRPEAKYAWSAGQAMSRFLNELKAGRFVARKCNGCGRILFPPRMFCEECFRSTDEWVPIEDTGTIETFSISYLDKDARRIKDPILVGVLSMDGASEGMGIMHYFDEVSPDVIHIGMPVEPVWKPESEREGAITDIRYFRPRREEDRR
jgi:uncharacterized OB-fold protein